MSENKKRIAYKPVLDFNADLIADYISNINRDMRNEGVPVAYVDDDFEKKFEGEDTICLNPYPTHKQLEAVLGRYYKAIDYDKSELDEYLQLVGLFDSYNEVKQNIFMLEQKAIAAGFEIVERDLEAEYVARESAKKAQGGGVVNGR